MGNTYTQGCKNFDCVYRLSTSGICDYFSVTGTSRTFLHKDEGGDINNPCREYKPNGRHARYQPIVKHPAQRR